MMKSLFFGLVILITAIFLRVYPGLDQILFTYDQARDLFMGEAIRSGDFKLVGPPTDIPGLFHGPLYYYFLAPFNSPETAILAVILLNLLAAIPLGILVQKMFNKKWLSLVAIFLFLASFEMVSYARWLSNPALVIPAISLWLLGLKLKRLPLVAIGLGLCIQFQFFMLYLLPLTILYFFKLPKKHLFKSLFIFSVLMSSFLVAEIKFKFQGILGLITFFSRQNGGGLDLISRLSHYFESLRGLFINNLFPPYPLIALGLVAIIILLNIYGSKKFREPVLFAFFILAGHFLVFFLSNTMHIFIGVGMGIAVILLTVNAIYILSLKSKALAGILFLIITKGLWINWANERILRKQ